MSDSANFRTCPGCLATFPLCDGPAYRYGVMSPECFAAFNAVLVQEGARYGYPPAHRLIVDACAVQHPPRLEHQLALGIESRLRAASIQSVAIHLIALYLALKLKVALPAIAGSMDTILTNMKKQNIEFPELAPPVSLGDIRLIDIEKLVMQADLPYEDYEIIAKNWATATWRAWAQHHGAVQRWYELYK